jgi:hypothetical protein
MITVYCTSKLKAFFKPIMSKEIPLPVGDRWNANLFYLKGRKCVAFLNKETVYVVVLFELKKQDLNNIQSLFTEAFINQLYSDRILDNKQESVVRNNIGTIYFRPTDNDKSALGSLNDSIWRLTSWNTNESDLIAKVKDYVSKQINETPMGSINFKYAKELMQIKIKNYR